LARISRFKEIESIQFEEETMKTKRVIALLFVAFALVLALPISGAAGDRQFTVVFNSTTLPANAAAIVQGAGARIISQIPEIGMMKVEGPASLLDTLGAKSSIQAISPTITFKLPAEQQEDAVFPGATFDTTGAFLYHMFQWDIKQVTNDGESFNLWPGSHQTVVAVLDTGINTQHQDLIANLQGGRNFVPDGPGGTVDPNDIEDKHGHGSHCAGAVAGNGLILGVGPNLGLRAYRVLAANGSGATDWILGAMIAAANDGVDVISMSIGGYNPIAGYSWTDPDTGTVYKGKALADFLAWGRAAKYVAAKGVVVVMAAANDAINISNPKAITNSLNEWLGQDGFYVWGASREIGTVPGVLTISATGPDQSPASYTNYGPGAIDLSAPGGDALRYPDMTPTPWYYDLCFSAYRNVGPPTPNWYTWMAGTSMATPKAAAVAALIIDNAKQMGKTLTPAQVVTRLQQSAIDLGKRGYDMFYGYGMVNAVSALTQK
jgi:lantibiotic leader peptide-processing serine protease